MFNSVNFWSSVSCIVLDLELKDQDVAMELGFFIDGHVHRYSFRPVKKYRPTKQAFWCTRTLHRNVRNSALLDYIELANIHPIALKGENFAKATEKRKLLGNLLDKQVENLDDHGCSKFKILWWGIVDMFELPIQTQEHTSLCRDQGQNFW